MVAVGSLHRVRPAVGKKTFWTSGSELTQYGDPEWPRFVCPEPHPPDVLVAGDLNGHYHHHVATLPGVSPSRSLYNCLSKSLRKSPNIARGCVEVARLSGVKNLLRRLLTEKAVGQDVICSVAHGVRLSHLGGCQDLCAHQGCP